MHDGREAAGHAGSEDGVNRAADFSRKRGVLDCWEIDAGEAVDLKVDKAGARGGQAILRFKLFNGTDGFSEFDRDTFASHGIHARTDCHCAGLFTALQQPSHMNIA